MPVVVCVVVAVAVRLYLPVFVAVGSGAFVYVFVVYLIYAIFLCHVSVCLFVVRRARGVCPCCVSGCP